MGEDLKRCEGSTATEDVMQLNCSKKSKLYSELENEYAGDVESPENAVSPAVSGTSGCYENDESTRVLVSRPFESPDLKNVDRQSENFGEEISTAVDCIFREATPTSELCGDSEQVTLMDSPSASEERPILPPPASPPAITSVSATKTPSAAELDEFFTTAEKYVQARFAEKYNYDVVKDVPLEGWYEWVPLHP